MPVACQLQLETCPRIRRTRHRPSSPTPSPVQCCWPRCAAAPQPASAAVQARVCAVAHTHSVLPPPSLCSTWVQTATWAVTRRACRWRTSAPGPRTRTRCCRQVASVRPSHRCAASSLPARCQRASTAAATLARTCTHARTHRRTHAHARAELLPRGLALRCAAGRRAAQPAQRRRRVLRAAGGRPRGAAGPEQQHVAHGVAACAAGACARVAAAAACGVGRAAAPRAWARVHVLSGHRLHARTHTHTCTPTRTHTATPAQAGSGHLNTGGGPGGGGGAARSGAAAPGAAPAHLAGLAGLASQPSLHASHHSSSFSSTLGHRPSSVHGGAPGAWRRGRGGGRAYARACVPLYEHA